MSVRAPYADRVEAGRTLARLLEPHGWAAGRAPSAAPVVLGLPRGGVPVAAQVALALRAPLDVLVVRKLGLPAQPELAMGAIAGVGGAVEVVRNETVLADAAVPDRVFDAVYRRELAELMRRADAYRGGRKPVAVRGRVVLVVDDGLATGSTMRAAITAVRRQQPSRLLAAVPTASPRSVAELREVDGLDEVVCPRTPDGFAAVGQAYRDFAATQDDEVRRLLREHPYR